MFDVWMMTMHEKLELILELLALADVSGMPPLKGNFELELEVKMQKEDFGSCSQ